MKTKNLKSTFFLCLVCGILSIKTNAQIVYTNVNPDLTVSCAVPPFSGTCTAFSSYYNTLDLNNDGTLDFELYTYARSGTQPGFNCSFGITPHQSSVSVLQIDTNSKIIKDVNGFPKVLFLNQPISASSDLWASGGYLRHIKACGTSIILSEGNFGTGYAGLKFVALGNTYYGWAKLYVTAGTSTVTFTVFEYAYNSIPNQPILAGETSCANPTVTLAASGPLSFCAGDSVTLTANGTGYQYQWKKGGVNISGATKQTYTAKTGGVYKCKVTNSCGSKTSGGKTVSITCRISNETFAETLEHLSVYPNPATNSVSIKFPSDEAGEVSIVNLFGQIVYSEKINTEQIQIDVSKFNSGMYVVRWSSGENNETKTFSVIK